VRWEAGGCGEAMGKWKNVERKTAGLTEDKEEVGEM
jgi:hypothetical protein